MFFNRYLLKFIRGFYGKAGFISLIQKKRTGDMTSMVTFRVDAVKNYYTAYFPIGRIALAQAFLKDSPILVLDEASANLDSENESKINEAVNTLKEGRAVLIIAHRLSTIKSAGRIEAQGSFEELMSSSQYFRELIGKEYE